MGRSILSWRNYTQALIGRSFPLLPRDVELLSDTPDEEVARKAIRSARAAVLIASPDARSSRIVRTYLALASDYQRQVFIFWARGENLNLCVPEGVSLKDTIDAREERYERACQELLTGLMQLISLGGTTPSPETSFEPRNPYKGLRAFEHDDARDFFGRDQLVQTLLATVQTSLISEQQNGPGSRLIAVVGPSGSGKSSVVMAGLLPSLRHNQLSGSKEWVYLDLMVPGSHPLEALALTLSRYLPHRSLVSLHEDLEADSTRGLHLLAASIAKRQGTHVVLFVDQFEELFTQTADVSERQLFIDLLTTAVTEPRGPLVTFLTLRADFSDRPMQYPLLHRLIEAQRTLVLPMEVSDLRAVIEQPASLPDVQLVFEDTLVGDLLFEMRGQIGALPLLQFTLDQLYQRRSGHLLTLKAYREIGGVKGALAAYAERIYMGLPSEEHRRLARSMFVRLIDSGTTEQDITRRRALLLEFWLDDDKQTHLLQETLDAFVKARLLTTSEAGGKATVEMSHEALIREWRRLSGWLLDARKDIGLQQTITRDATTWELQEKPRDRLYHGSQLKEAKSWATRGVASKNEVAFIRASAQYQRNRRILLFLLMVLTVGFVGGLVFRLVQAEIPPPALVVSPVSLTQASTNCSVISTIAQCTVTLGEANWSTGTVQWRASTDISDTITFNPASGSLSPGQATTVIISAIPCQNGSFTFSGIGKASFISVRWRCTPSPTASNGSFLKRLRLTYNIDYNGLLTDSASAINNFKQQIVATASLRGQNVALVIIYGGALSTSSADILQALSIDDKVRNILQALGQQDFAFKKSQYYDNLFILGRNPNTVLIDIYVFQK